MRFHVTCPRHTSQSSVVSHSRATGSTTSFSWRYVHRDRRRMIDVCFASGTSAASYNEIDVTDSRRCNHRNRQLQAYRMRITGRTVTSKRDACFMKRVSSRASQRESVKAHRRARAVSSAVSLEGRAREYTVARIRPSFTNASLNHLN